MRKSLLLTLITILSFSASLYAGEGMWILSLIGKNYEQMKAAGFKLSPEEIYSVNQACLKDAVLSLNHGECTAEFVSSKGLLFTNYHCGYDDIQSQSTLLHNYLADGFWAKTLAEELPIKNKTVSQLISIEDITNLILTPQVLSLSPTAQNDVIESTIETLQEDYSENGKYEVEISNFFEGNAYYLFKYIVYKDVRLVGAPPESLGQFGGDTDNFVWPRQTADFSIFRVYTAPDGSPVTYNEKNIPLKPKKYLTINAKGISEGDFAMTIGYPAETSRLLSSWAIEQEKNNFNAICIESLGKKLNTLKQFMDSDSQIKMQYAAKYENDNNTYKCLFGENESLDKLDVIKRKQNFEKQLANWITKNSKNEYKNILSLLQNDYKKSDLLDNYYWHWSFDIYQGCEFVQFALKHYMLHYYLYLGYEKKVNEELETLKADYNNYFRNYNQQVDLQLSKQMLQNYTQHVPKKYWPKGVDDADFYNMLEAVFQKSFLTNQALYEKFIQHPTFEDLNNDVLFLLGLEFVEIMHKLNLPQSQQAQLDYHKKLYTKAMIEMGKNINPDTLFYPDANSTMRLSYGKVAGYTYQGKDMGWITYVESYLAKKNNDNNEYVVPKKMEQLCTQRNFGPYAVNGTLPLNFLTTNDITGGNSGSPCLNANGELIGLAFDGNWEAMSCDYMYEPELQRCICVDIRFVLFIIDKFANAQNIIKELTIIK